ncbi:MAG: hypothetical protein DYH08_14885 [Actinobacteria bacterium ATB1]|nr:hypothetical protein [Actinobacteria bacterium ATB1]
MDDSAAAGFAAMMFVYMLIWLVVAVLAIVATWKVFDKAGQPGWAAIIPFYNIYIMLRVIGRPGWWLILYFIPFANIVVSLIVAMDLAKSFAKSTVFGVVGLWLFSIIGMLMLAFGDATYVGPAAAGPPTGAPGGGQTAYA